MEFTGERFVPGAPGEIVYEHVHRYAFACRFAAGRRVLDAACGEGYGSALLADVARGVTGIDVDAATIAHAEAAYRSVGNLRFVQGSVTAIPLAPASFDLIVSFETVEHLAERDQPAMLAEFGRVLAPDGLLLISSPNRPEYSGRDGHCNPFHLHELDREELAGLLGERFPARRWFRQRVWLGSMVRADAPVATAEQWEGAATGIVAAAPCEAMYFIVLAAADERALPYDLPSLSLFSDRDETELKRHAVHAREAIRLDGLAGERLVALDRQMLDIQQLERMVAERDAEVLRSETVRVSEQARNEAERAESIRARQACEHAIAERDRIIAERGSFRWWLALPWHRFKLSLARWRQR